ncbi:MAG: molybdenum ABC transporter ATP-binding protein [Rhodobacterales bacterium]|nr:molybdenum ABC transporter ATP-binding protein [Rhodobacterales bacterium]
MSLSVNITHNFGDFAIEAKFDAGIGVTALFGRSGTGKTTIVNAIAGLFAPEYGRISLGDEVLFDAQKGINLAPHKRRIGYVFQDGRLFPHLDVAQNLAFAARFATIKPAPQETTRIVDMLGLGTLLTRRPATLSGGEKQRVALGRALLSHPRLLLMDEPLAALDGPRKEEILPYLERLRDDNTTHVSIIYVSHAVDEIARLADQLVLIQNGRVVRAGDAFEVFSDPAAVPLLGVREAGAVMRAKVVKHAEDGLSRLRMSGGDLLVPGVTAPLGQEVRIRILAQDIILSLGVPSGLSTRNILPVVIGDIRMGDGPGAAISLIVGQDRLLARVTARAVAEMDLKTGMNIYALVKATAVPRGNISGGT